MEFESIEVIKMAAASVSLNMTDVKSALQSTVTFNWQHMADLFEMILSTMNQQGETLKQYSLKFQTQEDQILSLQQLTTNLQEQVQSQEDKKKSQDDRIAMLEDMLKSQQDQILTQQQFGITLQELIQSQNDKIKLQDVMLRSQQEYTNELNDKLNSLESTQLKHTEWIAKKEKESNETMNLFDVSSADPELAEHRKSMRYQSIAQPIYSPSIDIDNDKENYTTIYSSNDPNKTNNENVTLPLKDDSKLIKSTRPSFVQQSSLSSSKFTRLSVTPDPSWVDPSIVSSRPASKQNRRLTASTASISSKYVSNQSAKSASKQSGKQSSKCKSLAWKKISADRRQRILSELRIRGQYIVKAKTQISSNKEDGAKRDNTLELFTFSLHNRLLDIEKEMVESFTRLNIHEQLIANMPNTIRNTLFPNIDMDTLAENIKNSAELFIQFQSVGGISESVSQMKEYNFNVKEGKEEMRLQQQVLNNDMLDLKNALIIVDEKSDRAVYDVNIFGSAFNIQTSSQPPAGILVNKAFMNSVDDAKDKFMHATWNSISQLYCNLGTDNVPERSVTVPTAVDRYAVLNGLKDYILNDLIAHKDIINLQTDTKYLKSEFVKLDDESKKQLQQAMENANISNNKLAYLENGYKELKREIASNGGLAAQERFSNYGKSNGNKGPRHDEPGAVDLPSSYLPSKQVATTFSDEASDDYFENQIHKLTVEETISMETMFNQLKKLQEEMNEKPSVDSMKEMIDIIEHTFKKQLGDNVIGLKIAVGEVIKAVQQKATKDDVLTLVTKRVTSMKNSMFSDELNVAGSLRCISCGTGFRHGLNQSTSTYGSDIALRPFTAAANVGSSIPSYRRFNESAPYTIGRASISRRVTPDRAASRGQHTQQQLRRNTAVDAFLSPINNNRRRSAHNSRQY